MLRQQFDNKRLHWKAEIGGQEREWDAEIYKQVPDQRMPGEASPARTMAP
jgi:uncharacterized membrane protein